MSGLDFAGVRARHALIDVVARYADPKRQGNEWVCLCPFHNDGDASLTIFQGRDGFQRFHCFPCGAQGDVVDFMCEIESIEAAEAVRRLDGNQMPMPNTRIVRELPPDESDCWDALIPVPADVPAFDPKRDRVFNPKRPTNDDGTARTTRYSPTHVAEWRDHSGGLWGYVLRLEFDGKKVPLTVTYCVGPGGVKRWCAKRPPGPYPFVGAHLLTERPKAPVAVVEGEKKRDAAARLMPAFVWVSLYGGAEGVARMDVRPLVGRSVTLCPDADAPGRRAMHDLGKRLEAPA